MTQSISPQNRSKSPSYQAGSMVGFKRMHEVNHSQETAPQSEFQNINKLNHSDVMSQQIRLDHQGKQIRKSEGKMFVGGFNETKDQN